jgi:hypothetical protein
MGAVIKWCHAMVSTAWRRHWFRVSLCVILVAVPALIGWLLRPSPEEAPYLVGPKIVVMADQKDVAATVNMVLTVYPAHAVPSSKLQLTIVPASASGSATLTVELDDFPSGTTDISAPSQLSTIQAPVASSASAAPLQAAPQTPRNYSDYVVTGQTLGQKTPARITIVTENTPVGEAIKGAQLRVTFPALVGETPGANPSASLSPTDLYRGAPAPSSSAPDFPLALQAGSAAFMFPSTNLSEYQFLAGDSPVQLGSQWSWDGINDVTALAANIAAQDRDNDHLFYSGVAFGVAGGALISLVLELIPADPVKRDRARGHPDPA